MKRESLYQMGIALVIAAVSLVLAGLGWIVRVWVMGRQYGMPITASIRTAFATHGFGARVLLTAVLVFIILWIATRAWLARRPPKANT